MAVGGVALLAEALTAFGYMQSGHVCTPLCAFNAHSAPHTMVCSVSGNLHVCHADCEFVVPRFGGLLCTLTRVMFGGVTRAALPSGTILGAGAMGTAEDRRRSVARFDARKFKRWATVNTKDESTQGPDGGAGAGAGAGAGTSASRGRGRGRGKTVFSGQYMDIPVHKLSVLASKDRSGGLMPIDQRHVAIASACAEPSTGAGASVGASAGANGGGSSGGPTAKPKSITRVAASKRAAFPDMPTIAEVRTLKAGETLSVHVARQAALAVLRALGSPKQLSLNTAFMASNATTKATKKFLWFCSHPEWAAQSRAELLAALRALLWKESIKRGVWATPPSQPWLAALATLVANNYVAYTAAQSIQAAAGGRSACNLFPLTIREFTLACLRVFKQGFTTEGGTVVGPVNGLEFLPAQYPKRLQTNLLLSSLRPHTSNRHVSSFLRGFSTAHVDFPLLQAHQEPVGSFRS